MTDGRPRIALLVHGGLCNRLNAILSAVALLKKIGGGKIELRVYWEKTHDCHAWFDELFQPDICEGIRVERACRLYLRHSRKRNLYIPNILRRIMFDASYLGTDMRDKDFVALVGSKKKVFIESYNRFCPYTIESRLADYFRPIPLIEDRIKSVVDNFAPHTIGVHIRRTDNSVAIENSPLQSFVLSMDKAVDTDPQCMFYVATDNVEVKKQLIGRYGQRVVSPCYDLRRNSTQGMRDAVVDLFCLASTKEILGSTYSTFSTDAAAIYDIPLTIVKKV